MPSQLGKYTLVRTLGSGANSKVKLGLDKSTGRYFAVKILKKGNANLDAKFLELVMTEVHTMSQLSHSNIVNLIEYSKDGVVEKASGEKEHVIYIVLELATGGELFDYVATTGRFNEPIARFYFRQLIEGLDYVHQKGVTHRDLKPENVLFDQDFNLKIADFGFAAPIVGRDGSGNLTTKLGTESYMAPEIHLKKPYNGPCVDIFACGIILFIIVTQHPPFTKAIPSENFYKYICGNRADIFWKAHAQNKPVGFFSEEFKTLITAILAYEPTFRPSISDIKAHPWYNGPTASLDEIKHEFSQRKKRIDKDNEQKDAQKRMEKEAKNSGGAHFSHRKVYKNVQRSDENEDEEEKVEMVKTAAQDIDLKMKQDDVEKELDQYCSVVKRNTELFSPYSADTLLDALKAYCTEKGLTYNVKKDKYKIKINFPSEEVDIGCKILSLNENTNCIEFNRLNGGCMHFYDQFNHMRDFLGDLVTSTNE